MVGGDLDEIAATITVSNAPLRKAVTQQCGSAWGSTGDEWPEIFLEHSRGPL